MKNQFKCLDCGHTANEDAFGDRVACPSCKSQCVVNAKLWEQFHGEKSPSPATETQA